MVSLTPQATATMDTSVHIPSTPATPHSRRFAHSPRMQYRSRPVIVSVDPVSLVISECISITSALQKYARSSHSSVSAILGGSPNLVQLGPPTSALRPRSKPSLATVPTRGDATGDLRWGLRGQKGKSMHDNPLISGFGRLRQELTGVKGMTGTTTFPESDSTGVAIC